ncbi:MAG: hypothetical protein IT285_05795 [Bdellovibrionales bacterium]|nr:hypothetical protein [Bdellovibrionales bacterium]
MAGRWGRFIREMVPLFPSQLGIFATFAVCHWVLSRFFFYLQVPALELGLGGLATVAFVILLRVYDEVKDHRTDPVNFPNRPLVKGTVSLRDLKLLMVALNTLVLAANLPFVGKGPLFAVILLLLFGGGTYRWFFAEAWIRPRLTAAFLTHHPVVALQQFYVLSFFWFPGQADAPGAAGVPPGAVAYLAAVALGFTQWELGRKIRGTREETAYITYSKLYGPRPVTVVVRGLGILSQGLAFWSLGSAAWTPLVLLPWLLPACLWAHLLLKCLPFLKKPLKAPPIREGVERLMIGTLAASAASVVLSIWL